MHDVCYAHHIYYGNDARYAQAQRMRSTHIMCTHEARYAHARSMRSTQTARRMHSMHTLFVRTNAHARRIYTTRFKRTHDACIQHALSARTMRVIRMTRVMSGSRGMRSSHDFDQVSVIVQCPLSIICTTLVRCEAFNTHESLAWGKSGMNCRMVQVRYY